MAEKNVSDPPVIVPRTTKPVSEALLNEKWDRAISSGVVRGGLGAAFGIIASVLLFRRRAWPVLFGAGFGVGRAWEEADANFRRGDAPSPIQEGLRRVRNER